MTLRACVFLLLSATAAGPGASAVRAPPPNREVPAPNVSFERIQQSNKEPQNWLTYSGGLSSQRHSLLTAIQPGNARDLELKWVFQSRSLERHQVTPLVVDGTMYTIQSPNDVVALNAATGKQIWIYSVRAGSGGEELLRTAVPRRGDSQATRSFSPRSTRGSSPSTPGPEASCGRRNRPAIPSRDTRSLMHRSW